MVVHTSADGSGLASSIVSAALESSESVAVGAASISVAEPFRSEIFELNLDFI